MTDYQTLYEAEQAAIDAIPVEKGGAFADDVTLNEEYAYTPYVDETNYADSELSQVDITGIEISKDSTSIEVGSTETLTYTIKPSVSKKPVEIEWSSDDSEIASVENGVVTAVAEGVATITVSCGDFSDDCEVTVTAE